MLAQNFLLSLPAERKLQDYRSNYNDIRDWQRRERESEEKDQSTLSWDDVVFEVDLLKSQEMNLDYILELFFEYNQKHSDKTTELKEVKRLIRSNVDNRAKEGLMVDFIEKININVLPNKESVIECFYTFAQKALQVEIDKLIQEKNLNTDAVRRYIISSLKREYALDNKTALNEILPKLSPWIRNIKRKVYGFSKDLSIFLRKLKGLGGKCVTDDGRRRPPVFN